jgi:hypothetical protein
MTLIEIRPFRNGWQSVRGSWRKGLRKSLTALRGITQRRASRVQNARWTRAFSIACDKLSREFSTGPSLR